MEDYATLNLINSTDGVTLLVTSRIAAANQHYADSATRIKFDATLSQCASCNAFKEVNNITLQAQHNGFCFRVTHTDIVFDDIRLWGASGRVGAVYKSKEDKALIVDTLCCQAFNGRTDDAVLNLLHPFCCSKGDGTYTTHTACIQAGITFTDSFVVFGFG